MSVRLRLLLWSFCVPPALFLILPLLLHPRELEQETDAQCSCPPPSPPSECVTGIQGTRAAEEVGVEGCSGPVSREPEKCVHNDCGGDGNMDVKKKAVREGGSSGNPPEPETRESKT
eukprot:Hpha_TRINITY_DN16185_c0_g1::TRINITY_DN16185_c0_g1_i1::g.5502::m.5502